jgi:hypothetical protein
MTAGMHIDEAQQAALVRRAVRAVARAAMLADETRTAAARASTLVGSAVPLVTQADTVRGSVTDVLRALSELELVARSAERLAGKASSAGSHLATAAGSTPDVADLLTVEPVPPAPDADRPDNGTPNALRATARAVALAEATWMSVDIAVAEVQRAVAAASLGPALCAEGHEALQVVRAAARHADELTAVTAAAGRNLACAMCSMSEFPHVLSEERASLATFTANRGEQPLVGTAIHHGRDGIPGRDRPEGRGGHGPGAGAARPRHSLPAASQRMGGQAAAP